MNEVTHDVRRQVGYLQQALSQNRKPIGVFLGVGCPLSVRVNVREENGKIFSDPLVEDIAGLTRLVDAALSTDENTSNNWKKLIADLIADGIEEPNIEDILTRVRALQSVAGKGEARGFNSNTLEDIDRKICRIIIDCVNKELPIRDTAYHNFSVWARSRLLPVPWTVG